MVIIYGFGKYAENIFNFNDDLLDEIEVVIDRKCQTILGGKREREYKCISWENFVENKDKYMSNVIIIGTVDYENEIRKKIVDSGLFLDKNILRIDDWVRRHPIEMARQLIDNVGAIDRTLLKNAKVMPSRYDVLSMMPRNMVVAEVGVAFGDFSRKILDDMHPSKFYAVDIFDESLFRWNLFEETNMTHYEWYKNRFGKEIAAGIVELKKGYSWECLEQFPDDYFDYVYLDAGHDYISVSRDVEELKRVVKAGGIIQFNDYIFYDYVAMVPYGVMPVVNKFVNDTRSEVLYYCLSLGGFDDIVIRLNKQ